MTFQPASVGIVELQQIRLGSSVAEPPCSDSTVQSENFYLTLKHTKHSHAFLESDALFMSGRVKVKHFFALSEHSGKEEAIT